MDKRKSKMGPGFAGEGGKENDGYGVNCQQRRGTMDEPAGQQVVRSEGPDMQNFARERDGNAFRVDQYLEAPAFQSGAEEAYGAFAPDGDASIFDDQFVLLADGSGKGRDQQEPRTSKAAAGGKMTSTMFYMKKSTTEPQESQEGRRGLFSPGSQEKSESQMLPELNPSRRHTTMLGSTQSFSRQAQEVPSKKAIAQAFQDAHRLHSQSYTNGRGPLKAYQHSSQKQGLNNFMLPSSHDDPSMASGFLPSSSQDLRPDQASQATDGKPAKKPMKGIASQRVAEARQRIQRLNNQRDLLLHGASQPKRSFIQENRLKASQIQRRTQSTKMQHAKHNTMGSFYESKVAESARKQRQPGGYAVNSQSGAARLTKKNLQVFSKNFQGRRSSQLSQRSFMSHQSRQSAVKSINSARSRKSQMSQRSNNRPDRFAELYSVQNASATKSKSFAAGKNGRLWSSKTVRGYQNQHVLAIKKFEQLDELMSQNIQNLKNEVQNLQVENYLQDSKSLCSFACAGTKNGAAQGSTSLRDMPIRVLDSLIENEERKNNGFSVYNRGFQLKTSLIDAERVKAFVQQQERQQAQQRLMGGAQDGAAKRGGRRERAAERLPTKTTTKGDPEWDNMMDFFKANPAALMDALPTPPGSDCGSEAGDHDASKLGNSFAKASIKSTKSKTLGLNMAHLPYRAANRRENNGATSQRSGQHGLQRKNSVRSFASNKSFQSQGSRAGANAFRYNKGQPHNARLAAETPSASLGMSTSAAYGLPNKMAGSRHQPSWRLQSVKSNGGPKPGTAEALASKRLFNRGASSNNTRVSSTTGFFRGPPGASRVSDGRHELAKRQQQKPGRSAIVNRTMPHQRQNDVRKLNNRVSAAPASGKSSFLPTISPSAGRMSFSHLSAAYHGGQGHASFYSSKMPINETGSLLPQASHRLRANHGPPLPLPSGQHPGVKDVGRRKQATAAPISQKEYIDLHLDDADPVFQDYIVSQYDRLHKFQDLSLGTLTLTQLSSLSTLQVTVANKNSLAQQLRQTAKLVYRELIGSGQMCLHDGAEQDRPVYLLEYQHFEQSLGQKNLLIESVNKSLDKVQKLMRVRSEFLSLLASVHSCLNMFNDIASSSKEVFDIQAANKDSEAAESHEEVVQQSVQALSRKIKIFQKAAQLSIQQVDRFVALFNKNMDRLKLKKFFFVLKPLASQRDFDAAEELSVLDIRDAMGMRVQQTSEILQSVVPPP